LSNSNRKNTLVAIPAFNEQENIGNVALCVKKEFPTFDVLVIDDGSTDKTKTEALNTGVKVISFPFHIGGTAAVLTSYMVALKHGYEYLVKIDGDGQHKPEDIERVLQPLIDDEADISLGSRYLENNDQEENDSIIKIVGRVFSSTIINHLTKNVEISDITSGLRAWNRRALEILIHTYFNEDSLPDDSILWPVETLIVSNKSLRIKEIPIEVLPRVYGKSKSFSLRKMVGYPIRLIILLIRELW